MKNVVNRSLMIIGVGIPLLLIQPLYADDEKVPENVAKEMQEKEKQTPKQEKTEMGEASGNTRDCEKANEAHAAGDSVKKKDIDDCTALVK